MHIIPLIILVVLAGAGLALQAGVNTRLQIGWAQSPILTALISFSVGTITLFIALLLSRTPVPALGGKFVWWQWVGGMLGAFMVCMSVVAGQRLGASTMFALIVAGQMACSLILDHYGALGFAQHSFNWFRVLGMVFVIGGVIMIRKF